MANNQYFICSAHYQIVEKDPLNELSNAVKHNFNFGLVRGSRPTTQELVEIVRTKFQSAVNIHVIAGEVTKAEYNAYYNIKK